MRGLKIAGLDGGGPIKICAPCPGVWICIRAWPCHQAPALDQSKTTELRLPISETAANPVNYTAANRSRGARRLRPVTQAFKQISVHAAHTPPHAHTHPHASTRKPPHWWPKVEKRWKQSWKTWFCLCVFLAWQQNCFLCYNLLGRFSVLQFYIVFLCICRWMSNYL